MNPKILVLRAPGINCERETFDALARVGGDPEYVHVQELLAQPQLLDHYRGFVVPGGFAYGDDIAAGRVLANELRQRVGDRLLGFVNRGGLVLGICNGFQVLVRVGLLPRIDQGEGLRQDVSLTHNLSDRYECRWVRVRAVSSRCVFVPANLEMRCPAAHGEGRLVARDDKLQHQLLEDGFRVFAYVDDEGNPTDAFPANPNGSPDATAGLTDSTGRVLGLMPHPDRSYLAHHLPGWRRDEDLTPENDEGDGLVLFREFVRTARTEG